MNQTKSATSKNQVVDLTIDSLANSGDGVGRIDNKVIFVPYSAPGDKLKVEITQNKKTFAKGEVVEVVESSNERTEPNCQYFGDCGGCDWQHVGYEKQLEWKRKNLQSVLEKIGGLADVELVENTQPCSQVFGYRNRIQVNFDKNGIFYFKKGSKQKCYIDECAIADPLINEWLKTSGPKQKMKGKLEIALNPNGEIDLFKVDQHGQSELGFRQVNSEQNHFIQTQILNLIEQENLKTVTDLYCGQGNFTLSIAERNPDIECLGVDINPTNNQWANDNRRPNTRFLLGDVGKLYEQWSQGTDLTIIDPPRSGCDDIVLDCLNKNPSPWLAYISCHPATMARDLKHLLASGWEIHLIKPVDMFPQTSHLECLTILRSAKG